MKNTKFSTKVLKTIKDNRLLPENAKVLCGVSGGADSVSLLTVLAELGKYELYAVHVNHCIRGAESDRDEEFVRTLCEEMNVPLHVERVDVPKIAAERGLGTEECARDLRYEIFQSAAQSFGAEYIATAHNANDNLETAIFNLLRGTGVTGLAGIPPKRMLGSLTVVRPLISCSREEIEEYLAAKGVKYVVDSTNLGNDYARNRIRHEIIPRLRELNPEIYETVPSTQKLLRREADYIAEEGRKAYERIADGNKCGISKLLEFHPAIFGRVVGHFYKAAGGENDLSMANCDAVYAAAVSQRPSAVGLLPGGIEAVREYDTMVFRKKSESAVLYGVLEIDKENLFCDGRVRITVSEGARPEKFGEKNIFYLDRDKIKGKLFVRARQEGDCISLAGHNNSKTLKKLMIDLKIPKDKRSLVPVICDDAGIAAVGFIGVDERVKIEKNTKNLLRIDIKFTEDV